MIPEAIEAAAKAEYEHEFLYLEGVWEEVPEAVKVLFRESAKVALEAAAPYMLAEASADVAAAFANAESAKRAIVARALGIDPEVARSCGYGSPT